MLYSRVFTAWLLAIATVLYGGHAGADADSRISHSQSIYVGGGAWVHPERGGHGIGRLTFDLEGLPKDARFGAEFNTDTLRLRYDRLRFLDGLLEVGFDLAGEAVFSGLLPDYYQGGRLDEERGFNASYLLFGGYVKLNLPRKNYLGASVHGRRWFFATADETADAFVLPDETWVVEPRLSYTYWNVKSGLSLWHPQRLFPRVTGFAFGLQLGMDWRGEAAPWGARDADEFEVVDLRNEPDQAIWMARQWARFGARLGGRWRVELFEAAAWGEGEDDLTRVRIGGLNPYVFPIAGAPWAAYLAERFVGLEASIRLGFGSDHEVGLLVQDAVIEDVERVGAFGTVGNVFGVGFLLDLRLVEKLQLDLRGGYTPSLPQNGGSGQFAFFAGIGYGGRSS